MAPSRFEILPRCFIAPRCSTILRGPRHRWLPCGFAFDVHEGAQFPCSAREDSWSDKVRSRRPKCAAQRQFRSSGSPAAHSAFSSSSWTTRVFLWRAASTRSVLHFRSPRFACQPSQNANNRRMRSTKRVPRFSCYRSSGSMTALGSGNRFPENQQNNLKSGNAALPRGT